jgi:Uma2 family endonuclease
VLPCARLKVVLNALPIPHPLSRAEYEAMVERGELDDERVELLRGELCRMSPQGPLHAHAATRLSHLLFRALSERAWVRMHSPLAVSADSEPEPDLAVVPRGDFAGEHPTAAHLVIEISSSSLDRDRNIKAALYAGCGIPEYWIVNLVEEVIEVHRNPEGGMYRTVTTSGRGSTIELALFPEVRIAVDAVLGAQRSASD